MIIEIIDPKNPWVDRTKEPVYIRVFVRTEFKRDFGDTLQFIDIETGEIIKETKITPFKTT